MRIGKRTIDELTKRWSAETDAGGSLLRQVAALYAVLKPHRDGLPQVAVRTG